MTKRPAFARRSLLLAAALASPLLGQSPGPSYPIPKTLTMVHGTLPIWADASVVLLENGEPNSAIFGDNTRGIREILEQPADNPIYYNGKVVGYGGVAGATRADKPIYVDGRIVGYSGAPSAPGCRDVGPTYIDYAAPPPRATLEDAVAHSEIALLGRVTAKAYGFSDGTPGQLLQIQPILSHGHPLSQPRYYFFVPIGKFHLRGVLICKMDQRYADPPDVGGEVFLFVAKPVDPAGVLLQIYDPGDVVAVNPDGSLRLPRQYAAGDQDADRRAATARVMRSDLLDLIQSRRSKGAPK
jgi:hypothetical protein